ncbi:hypothetical protein PQX77_001511 [Marasmius sp. AFHP31]|nr:hypothetical protein PQX77_001511 [Marasmius sp. AFHP31]
MSFSCNSPVDVDMGVESDGFEASTRPRSRHSGIIPASFAGPSTLPRPETVTPNPTSTFENHTPETRTRGKQSAGHRTQQYHPYARPPDRNRYNTRNNGDSNKFYNSSQVHETNYDGGARSSKAVVHFNLFHESRTPQPSSTLRRVSPPANSHATAPHSSPPPSGSESSSQPGPTGNDNTGRTQTRSRSYESLLLRCELGCPLWMPSPRCTLGGKYIPDIGDVGFLSHGLPFNILFNITQPPNSLANRDGIPSAGVDPPYTLRARDVMIKEGFHPPWTVFFQPKGAILEQDLAPVPERLPYTPSDYHDRLHGVHTYHLSEKEGALLMLPQGSTLQNLDNTARFVDRVRLYWRQWYEFADEQVHRDNGQALYLVTGVERCTAWAMAAWDSISSYARDDSRPLTLTIDSLLGKCEWASPPARCSTQSESQGDQETVFIRGFWIGRHNGTLRPSIPPSGPGDFNDDNKDANPNSGGGPSRSQNLSGDPSSRPPPSTGPPFPGNGRSGGSGPASDSLAPQMTETPISLNLDLYFPNGESDVATHPCRAINKFAFDLVSCLKPALLESGCAAISHDDDWINIIQESDEKFPPGAEIIRRICSNVKFTIEGDAIYTVSMTDSEKEFLRHSETSPLRTQSGVISVLVVFAENDNAIGSSTTDAPLPVRSTNEPDNGSSASSWPGDETNTHVTRMSHTLPPMLRSNIPPDASTVSSPRDEVDAFAGIAPLPARLPIKSNIWPQPSSHSKILHYQPRKSLSVTVDSNDSKLWEMGSDTASTQLTSVLGDEASFISGTYSVVGPLQSNRSQPTVASAYESLEIKIAGVGASHKTEHQSERGTCLPGTRVDTLKSIRDWKSKKEQDHPICLLSGAAGVGKSAIAMTIARECEAEGTLVSSFFFFRADPNRNNPSALWLTIADGLASTIPAMRNVIGEKISKNPSVLESALENQFHELILTPASMMSQRQAITGALPCPNIVVIDGLDECGDKETQLRILSAIQSAYQQAPLFPLRFLICSRPESWIWEAFAREPLVQFSTKIDLDNSLAAHEDIRRYYLHYFHEIVASPKYNQVRFSDPWPSEEDLNILVERASGQFTYAETAIKFIKDAFDDPMDLLYLILESAPSRRPRTSPYSQLDALYDVILNASPDYEGVMSILATILILPDYLEPTPAHIELVLGLPPGKVGLTLRGMHSELDIRGRGDTIRLYHTSFRDYLVNEARSRNFHIDLGAQQYAIAYRWLRGLTSSKIQTYSAKQARGEVTESFFTKWIGLCTSLPEPTQDLLDDLWNVDLASIFLVYQQSSWKDVFEELVPWVRKHHGPGKEDVDREVHGERTDLVDRLIHKFQNHPGCFHLEYSHDPGGVLDWVISRATGGRELARLLDCRCDLSEGKKSNDPGHLAYQEACLQLFMDFTLLFKQLALSGADDEGTAMELTGIFGDVTNSLLLKHCCLRAGTVLLCQTFFELAKGCLVLQVESSDGWEGRKNLLEWIANFPDMYTEEGEDTKAQVLALPWEQWAQNWDRHFKMGLGGGGHLRGNRKGKGKGKATE